MPRLILRRCSEIYINEMRRTHSELRTTNFPNLRQECSTVQCHVIRGLRVYLFVTKLQHNNTKSLSVLIHCYVLRQFPTRYPPTGGPGELSRYSDSLRAGRSRDRMPVEASFSAPVQTGPGAQPASSTMGTRAFSGKKRPKRGVNHPHPI
jgi:hypothetical protein